MSFICAARASLLSRVVLIYMFVHVPIGSLALTGRLSSMETLKSFKDCVLCVFILRSCILYALPSYATPCNPYSVHYSV